MKGRVSGGHVHTVLYLSSCEELDVQAHHFLQKGLTMLFKILTFFQVEFASKNFPIYHV